jgi:hypothetical protein
VLCVLGPRRTTGLALWACSVVLFRVKWRAVSREEHVLGSTVRASVRGGQRKLGLPAETASSAQARSNSGVGFSCPDPVNEPSTLVILGKQGWFPDVGFRKQARKPTPPVNECENSPSKQTRPVQLSPAVLPLKSRRFLAICCSSCFCASCNSPIVVAQPASCFRRVA